jgi:hypothetical protein
MADEDAWDAFGSDDDDDEGKEERVTKDSPAMEIVFFVSQFFLKQNSQVRLKERLVALVGDELALQAALRQREIQVVTDLTSSSAKHVDAIIVLRGEIVGLDKLLPGGLLVTTGMLAESISDKEFQDPIPVYHFKETTIVGNTKHAVKVHSNTCPFLPTSHSVTAEYDRLQDATIALSASEVSKRLLTDSSIQRAVRSMNEHGYCIIRNLMDPVECATWGQAVLDSVHEAAKILLDRDHVDIYHPHTSEFEPQSYRELTMREDLRLDLRHGGTLSRLRSKEDSGDENVIIGGTTRSHGFLRGQESLLDIVRLTMNPKAGDLYKGNMGRYNFEGSGPDGSFQDLRVSPVGGVVSFPGAAEQALHADTPHLFENNPDLPAHYINIFAPGIPFDDKVGGTAFVHGSHNLEFTTKYCGNDNSRVYPYLVRPSLTLGDVLLFDCRTLHFGMANTSSSVERVLLYTNTTHAWFHDPKNWDNRSRIFKEEAENDRSKAK